MAGFALNTGGAYAAEDVTGAAFRIDTGVAGTGIWNFNADAKTDVMTFTGSAGTLTTPVFADGDVVVSAPPAAKRLPSAIRPTSTSR